MRLKQKVALITGAGNGIGRATAILFAKEGADIAVNDVNLQSADETAEEIRRIGRKAISVKADVGEADEVDAMVDRVIKELGGVHILVNNAGITDEGSVPTIESSIEHWDKVMRVHVRGTYLCSRRVGQWMVSHKTGKIVNTGSIAGIGGFAPRASYGPAKAAIIQMTRCLAVEWAKYNINVNCIAPGYTRSSNFKEALENISADEARLKARIPLGRFNESEDIANTALFLVSEEARNITGLVIPVDGGWLAYGM